MRFMHRRESVDNFQKDIKASMKAIQNYKFQYTEQERSNTKSSTFTCKDFIKDLYKLPVVEFSHILLYRSSQPFPLKQEVSKVLIREQCNIQDPPKSNQMEVLKLNNIRSYLSHIKYKPKIQMKRKKIAVAVVEQNPVEQTKQNEQDIFDNQTSGPLTLNQKSSSRLLQSNNQTPFIPQNSGRIDDLKISKYSSAKDLKWATEIGDSPSSQIRKLNNQLSKVHENASLQAPHRKMRSEMTNKFFTNQKQPTLGKSIEKTLTNENSQKSPTKINIFNQPIEIIIQSKQSFNKTPLFQNDPKLSTFMNSASKVRSRDQQNDNKLKLFLPIGSHTQTSNQDSTFKLPYTNSRSSMKEKVDEFRDTRNRTSHSKARQSADMYGQIHLPDSDRSLKTKRNEELENKNIDPEKLNNIMDLCTKEIKLIKKSKRQVNKKEKQLKQRFDQCKKRINYNLDVNKQDNLPEEMLNIKAQRQQELKQEELKKDQEKLKELENMAQYYHKYKDDLRKLNKKQLIESIKKTQNYLQSFYQNRSGQKAEEIPNIIKDSDLTEKLDQKTLIEIYTNFDLQYLQHIKTVREEIKARKRELKVILSNIAEH